MYRFNYSGATWTETTHYGGDGFGPAPSGGGGGTSGGGVLKIEYDEALGSYNKTFREVETAFIAGTTVMWYVDTINGIYYLMDGLDVSNLTVNFGGGNILMADSEDGYLFLPD